MSNQPDQPQPYPGEEPNQAPAGYYAPAVPPYQAPVAPESVRSQNAHFQDPPVASAPYGQPHYVAQQAPQYWNQQAPQHGAPAYYQGTPAYAVSGPRGLSLTSMILGLTSLILLGFLIVPQIIGIILGHLGIRRESPQGRAFAITGLITNYLALLIWGGLYVFMIIGLAAMGGDSYRGY